ncbi:MAG: hypothetical protein GHCLOJNM_02852 [bacterium]|nr:hypothetical protein [bacterium]
MIEIHPNRFYTRGDLAELLAPAGVDVDHFIATVKPRRVLKALYRGSDLLTGWDRARELGEPVPIPQAKNSGGRRRKTGPNGSEDRLIGGIFSREEIGL